MFRIQVFFPYYEVKQNLCQSHTPSVTLKEGFFSTYSQIMDEVFDSIRTARNIYIPKNFHLPYFPLDDCHWRWAVCTKLTLYFLALQKHITLSFCQIKGLRYNVIMHQWQECNSNPPIRLASCSTLTLLVPPNLFLISPLTFSLPVLYADMCHCSLPTATQFSYGAVVKWL